MSDFIRIFTNSPAGDLMAFMSGFNQLWKDIGKKCIVYQRINMPGIGYDEAIHPFENEQKEPVTMSQQMFEMLQPLLRSQPYIEDYLPHNGEDFDFDMNLLRLERYTGQPGFSLHRWTFQVFPQMTNDLSKKWMDVPAPITSICKGKVVLNFTQRYRNHLINYHFLKSYEAHLIFAGMPKEHQIFCKMWNLDIPILEVKNFRELASEFKTAKFFLGNASFCFHLCEAMKIPRILELFPRIPNVITTGEHAYDYFNESSVQYRFEKLMKEL